MYSSNNNHYYINKISPTMSALSNLWGPKYAGPVGQFKKAVEIANLPWNFPFLTGFLAAGALVLSIPVSGM